jgi:hypothetical protein
MLPTNDKKLLDKLSYEIFAKPFQGDIGYVFYENDEAVGFARLEVGDTSTIIEVGVLNEHRKKGLGDFFTRSILFRLSQISRYIRIGYKSSYYLPMGFDYDEDGMKIAAGKLVFPHNCKHC